MAFPDIYNSNMQEFDFVIDFLFLFDVIVNFFFAYYDPVTLNIIDDHKVILFFLLITYRKLRVHTYTAGSL